MTSRDQSQRVEHLVRSVARSLEPGRLGLKDRLFEFVIGSVMRNHQLRVGVFRFAEAFPAMEGPDDVLGHLRGYLIAPGIPWWVRHPIALASRMPFGGRIAAWVAERGISSMAKHFIGGRRAAEVEPLAKRLWVDGVGVIIDALGEKTVTTAQAEDYEHRILEIVTHLGAVAQDWPPQPSLEIDHLGSTAKVAVAIKPTGLSAKYHPMTAERGLAEVTRRLEPIMKAAVANQVMVWLDMEQYSVKGLTQRLFKEMAETYPTAEVGIVVQAYLRDSFEDLKRIIDQSAGRAVPIGIRLVKGAYWDYETVVAAANGWPQPVYAHKQDTDANFERCSTLMVESASQIRPSFASHNIRSLAHALATSEAQGLSKKAPEVQALHGMGGELAAASSRAGYRTRIYVPVGALIPGMSYLVRRLLENTSNESFIRQNRSHPDARSRLPAAPTFVDEEIAT